jgi:hypothetical protein
MRALIGFTFGIVIALIGVTYLVPAQPAQTVYTTEVIEREIVTTLDLEELRQQLDTLDGELFVECINVIERYTQDPRPGIMHHVERHYEGDACKAADEAMHGNW